MTRSPDPEALATALAAGVALVRVALPSGDCWCYATAMGGPTGRARRGGWVEVSVTGVVRRVPVGWVRDVKPAELRRAGA